MLTRHTSRADAVPDHQPTKRSESSAPVSNKTIEHDSWKNKQNKQINNDRRSRCIGRILISFVENHGRRGGSAAVKVNKV
jgi:hypothetical protein